MMEALLGIILLVGLGLTMWQLAHRLNQQNERLKNDLDTIVQRCEKLTSLVSDLQDEIVKMESQQQLVEK